MVYFLLSIFLSAFLIFQVQPMIAKYILPWFGGASAVWSTVQMFFQVLLTGGYAYAAWIARPGQGRERLHLALLFLSFLAMVVLGVIWRSPVTPDSAWKPAPDAPPVWEILKVLAVSVGLPYFLLASNSPLMQAWFHRLFPERTAYRLYAVSNIGSLVGLVAYPFLIEPTLTLPQQGWVWSVLYITYAGLASWGAIRSLRAGSTAQPASTALGLQGTEAISWRRALLWVALAATASVLLLAVTSHMTQEVAVIPFLWVLPLSLYLLSFIVTFSGERWYSRPVFLVLLFVSMILAEWVRGRVDIFPTLGQIGVYALLLFSAAMLCHGELYRLRPAPARLTTFYLLVSIGGALGGIFVTFVAPLAFRGYWELPLGLVSVWALLLLIGFRSWPFWPRWRFILEGTLVLSALIVAVIRTGGVIRSDVTDSLWLGRNFYGVTRVKSLGADGWPSQRYALVHGVTIHGFQYARGDKRHQPTAYFSETSGVGLAILNHPARAKQMRVGVLGLGIGTLAVYGQPGDVYRFYEINPQIIDLAWGEGGYFSYLRDSQAKIEVVLGDARLSLERELALGKPQAYHVLIMDVFSSDSIPVHLLNRESFALYLQHLAPDGILAVHISNRHLDLLPVVWLLSDYYGLERVVIRSSGDYEQRFPSLWVLLSLDPNLLAHPEIASRAANMVGYAPSLRLWTDDYSNLIQILK
ncbi:MAG: hypothetical protein N2049_11965 [Anaerolineales bacterium]|nr:hypothetical protein [Anaerolineales bacterium]